MVRHLGTKDRGGLEPLGTGTEQTGRRRSFYRLPPGGKAIQQHLKGENWLSNLRAQVSRWIAGRKDTGIEAWRQAECGTCQPLQAPEGGGVARGQWGGQEAPPLRKAPPKRRGRLPVQVRFLFTWNFFPARAAGLSAPCDSHSAS